MRDISNNVSQIKLKTFYQPEVRQRDELMLIKFWKFQAISKRRNSNSNFYQFPSYNELDEMLEFKFRGSLLLGCFNEGFSYIRYQLNAGYQCDPRSRRSDSGINTRKMWIGTIHSERYNADQHAIRYPSHWTTCCDDFNWKLNDWRIKQSCLNLPKTNSNTITWLNLEMKLNTYRARVSAGNECTNHLICHSTLVSVNSIAFLLVNCR